MGSHVFHLKLQLGLGTLLGPFERHVLEEVRHTIRLLVLEPAPRVNPQSNLLSHTCVHT